MAFVRERRGVHGEHPGLSEPSHAGAAPSAESPRSRRGVSARGGAGGQDASRARRVPRTHARSTPPCVGSRLARRRASRSECGRRREAEPAERSSDEPTSSKREIPRESFARGDERRREKRADATCPVAPPSDASRASRRARFSNGASSRGRRARRRMTPRTKRYSPRNFAALRIRDDETTSPRRVRGKEGYVSGCVSDCVSRRLGLRLIARRARFSRGVDAPKDGVEPSRRGAAARDELASRFVSSTLRAWCSAARRDADARRDATSRARRISSRLVASRRRRARGGDAGEWRGFGRGATRSNSGSCAAGGLAARRVALAQRRAMHRWRRATSRRRVERTSNETPRARRRDETPGVSSSRSFRARDAVAARSAGAAETPTRGRVRSRRRARATRVARRTRARVFREWRAATVRVVAAVAIGRRAASTRTPPREPRGVSRRGPRWRARDRGGISKIPSPGDDWRRSEGSSRRRRTANEASARGCGGGRRRRRTRWRAGKEKTKTEREERERRRRSARRAPRGDEDGARDGALGASSSRHPRRRRRARRRGTIGAVGAALARRAPSRATSSRQPSSAAARFARRRRRNRRRNRRRRRKKRRRRRETRRRGGDAKRGGRATRASKTRGRRFDDSGWARRRGRVRVS